MNKLLIFILFIHFTVTVFSQKIDFDSLECHYANVQAIDFFNDIENKTDLIFYYKSNWIQNITINLDDNKLAVNELLTKAFENTGLVWIFKKPNKIIILDKQDFVSELPNFEQNIDIIRINQKKSDQRFNENAFLKGRFADERQIYNVGNKNNLKEGFKVNVNLKILDFETHEPLVGATIYFQEIKYGKATNDKGDLSFLLLPGKYSTQIKYMGMIELKCQVIVYSQGNLVIYLNKDVKNLEEVTINSEQGYKIRGNQLGLDKIEIKSVKSIPSLMGEKDIIKIAQMLPGVVSVNEGSSGVNVRGGNADQNLFYINDIPLYNTSHLFGFFSTINTSLIHDFSLYKGNIPTQYGGRLSSVFTVATRKGNKNKLFLQGGISPISANLEIEGPIIKKKLSFVVSARSSYSDWILNKLPSEELKNSSTKFSDIATSFDWDLNEKNRVSMMAYTSSDFFNMNKVNEYSYGNLGVGANYLHRFSSRLKSEVSILYSKYGFNTKDWNNSMNAYSHSFDINHYETKASISWIATHRQTLRLGGNLINYHINRGSIDPIGNESEVIVNQLGTDNGFEGALFIDDNFEVFPWLKILGGIRVSRYTKYGPETVYQYQKGLPYSSNTVIDSLVYGSDEQIVTYSKPEFRLAMDIKMSNYSSLKFAYTEMSQYLYLLSNTYAVSPIDQWKLCDTYIKPASSRQISTGVYKTFPNAGFSLSGETYIKKSEGVVEFKDGADFLNSKNVETVTLQGLQDSYGIEFMVTRDKGKLNGWISYAYSRSFMKVDGSEGWRKINGGETYPSNYDKPHVLNIIGNYTFNRRMVLSSNIVYSTGRPITLPKSVFYFDNMEFIDYSKRNEYRIPDYFRIDLSLTLEGNLKASKWFHSYWIFSIYNLTGRNNPYSVYFKSEDRQIKGYQYSIIGVPIFTVSWNFKLGNYASE